MIALPMMPAISILALALGLSSAVPNARTSAATKNPVRPGTTVAKYGSTINPRPMLSMTIIVSTALPFKPPWPSGNGSASTPNSANWRQTSRLNPSAERTSVRRFSKP